MTPTQIMVARIAFNVTALFMLLAAWRSKPIGRLSFVALFLWAGQKNVRTVWATPEVYLESCHAVVR